MPRIDLSVPYEEKDEAKKLGARWDAGNKIWFIPDGTNPDPFKKWLPIKRPPPDVILFKPTSEGELAARIDNLEVNFYDDGCCIVVWGTETGVPCDYSDSVCPEDENRHWQKCPVADNCPYEFTRPMQDISTSMSNEGTREELETKIKDMFINKHDGIAHKQRWPEPAASEFAYAKWQFEKASWLRKIFGR